MWIKQLIIRLLFRLVGSPYLDKKVSIEEEKMRDWLGNQFPLKTFNNYIEKRDKEILQQLGNVLSREVYLIVIGQRTELSRFYAYAKECYASITKKPNKKLRATRK